TYNYDDAGNRTSVTSSGISTLDGLASALSFSPTQNRVDGWEYDDAGNLIQGKADDATTQRYQYDAAGRLVRVYQVGTTGGVAPLAGGPVCRGNPPPCTMPDLCSGQKICTDSGIWFGCDYTMTSSRSCDPGCGASGQQSCGGAGVYGTCTKTSCCSNYQGA